MLAVAANIAEISEEGWKKGGQGVVPKAPNVQTDNALADASAKVTERGRSKKQEKGQKQQQDDVRELAGPLRETAERDRAAAAASEPIDTPFADYCR